MTTSYPTVLQYGIATVNNRSTPDLPRVDSRKVMDSVLNQAGRIGFQENIGTDDVDLATVFPDKDWYRWGTSTENDQVVRKARWRPTSPARLALLAKEPSVRAYRDKHGKNPLLNAGVLRQRGGIEIGTAKAGVQPQRTATWSVCDFVENPLLTPEGHVNFHLVSAVHEGADNLAYRKAERKDQYAQVKALVLALKGAGINVWITCDGNWEEMPPFTAATKRFVDGGIDKVWFEPGAVTGTLPPNWTVESLGTPESIDNPSDHNARVVNARLTVNSRYKAPVVLTQTTAQKVAAWEAKYGVSATAAAELKTILGF